MSSVFKLAYVDLTTPSLDTARTYYRDVLGATEEEVSSSSSYLRIGLDHHTVAVHQGERASLGAIGLQLSAGVPIEAVGSRLREIGLSPEVKHDARPGVPMMIEVAGVGGHDFQLFPEIALSPGEFSSGGIAPLRIGHVAVLSTDADKLLTFLREGLGFHTTDWFDDFVTFITCNYEHHVLNVISAPVNTLHHIAFEMPDRADQVRAADLLAARKMNTLWGPARHTAGHNVASYHYGADGALIELYNDMDVFLPALGYCDPRPGHGDRPQLPKRWRVVELSRWDTKFEFDLAAVAFGMPNEGMSADPRSAPDRTTLG